MGWTRREWLTGAATGLGGLFTPRSVRAQTYVPSPPPTVPTPPTLPDRAGFEGVSGLYMDSAATHPVHAGAEALRRSALRAMAGDDGFRPDSDRVKTHFAKLINAHLDDIVFVPSTQVGESLVGAGLGLPVRGAHVVTNQLHFVGSIMMYTDMKKLGVEVSWIKPHDGRLRIEDYDRAIVRGKTKLVALSSASMINGSQPDIAAICAIAHARGAWVHVDAIQTVGNAPIDVQACGADSLCAGSYKWMIARGPAFLYVRPASLKKLRKPIYGFYQYSYPGENYLPRTHMLPFDKPGKELVDDYWPMKGTEGVLSVGYQPSDDAIAELEYSLSYIRQIGVDRINAHNRAITTALKTELLRRGATLMTPPESTSPIVTIAYPDAERLAPALRQAGVRVTTRWNHVRIAPSVFNDVSDVDQLLRALPL